jgi:CRP/FNR family transcriptional regulator
VEHVLDLRSTPTWERHNLVCAAFTELPDDDTLRLIYDYEPRPLRRRFDNTFSQQFVWLQRRLAAERWEILLRKVVPSGVGESVVQFMNRCAIFVGSTESTREILAEAVEQRSVRRKTTIAEQETDWPYLAIVRAGRVYAITGTPFGRDQILFEALETEVFGNIVLFDGGSTIARFATLAYSADLLLFPRAAVLKAGETDAHFAFALAAAAAQQVRTIAELVQGHVSKKTIGRVAVALRPYAPAEGGLAMVDPANIPSLRLSQIATATGTVKEVAARAVAELEDVGAIRRVRGRIAYIDRAKLARFIT